MSRIKHYSLQFEIESSVLAEALNVTSGTDNHVILFPLNQEIMIANLNGDYAMYKLLSAECFAKFDYHKKLTKAMINKPNDIEYFVFDKTALVQLLNKIEGDVRISIDNDRPSVKKLYIEDVDGIDVNFTGNIILSDVTISPNRASAPFIQYFGEEINEPIAIPKFFLIKGIESFHIYKLRKNVDFNPLIVNSKANDQITMSFVPMNEKSGELKIENKTLDSSFASNFNYLLYQSTDEEKIAKAVAHSLSTFRNGYNPKVIQNILRFATANYSYLTLLVREDENYFVFSGSLDLEEGGRIYCTVNPFMEELHDGLDLSDLSDEVSIQYIDTSAS